MTASRLKVLSRFDGWVRVAALVLGVVALALAYPYVGFLLMANPVKPVDLVVAVVAWLLGAPFALAAMTLIASVIARLADPTSGSWLFSLLLFGCLLVGKRKYFSTAVAAVLFAGSYAVLVTKSRYTGSLLNINELVHFFSRVDNLATFTSQPTLLHNSLAGLGGAAIFLVVVFFFDRRRRRFRHAIAAPIVLACAASFSVYSVAHNARELDRFDPWKVSMQAKGNPMTAFFGFNNSDPRVADNGIDTSAVTREVALLKRKVSAPRPADIMVFLQESQFNPRAVSFCPEAFCALKHRRSGQLSSGPLRVHTTGTGTWLSEWAFLTGLPHTIFGPAAGFISFDKAPLVQESLPRSLRRAGYKTIALYPVKGGFMNARQAYAGYGFDLFLDSHDLGLTGDFNTPDANIHQLALDVLTRYSTPTQPVFVFALTIFNHSDHGILPERIDPMFLTQAAEIDANPSVALNLGDYMWRTRAFESSFAHVLTEIAKRPQPTVVSWFGDHTPMFGGARKIYTSIRPLANDSTGELTKGDPTYFTWYGIYSNQTNLPDPDYRSLDIDLLPGAIAEAAGVESDDWIAANRLARQSCSGRLTECGNKQFSEAYLTYLLRDLKVIRPH